jgi:hypothetical protein
MNYYLSRTRCILKHLEMAEFRDLLALPDLKAHKAQRGLKGLPELPGHKEIKELLDLRGHKDLLVQMD